MNDKIIAALVALALVGGAFYVGTLYQASRPAPVAQQPLPQNLPKAPSSIIGTVTAKTGDGFTLKTQDGADHSYTIGTSTVIFVGIDVGARKALSDITVGASVAVIGGLGGGPAQTIQIASSTSGH